MKLLFIFALAFVIALVVVLTFIQPAFQQKVGLQILTYQTRPFSVVYFVLGSFLIGLCIGFFTAIWSYIISRTELFKKNRHIKSLELELKTLKSATTETSRPNVSSIQSDSSAFPGE
jgi:uncharacterized membrane protein YciS (DUF1049 family)